MDRKPLQHNWVLFWPFKENDRSLAQDTSNAKLDKPEAQKIWSEITDVLNRIPGAVKTAEQWKIAWRYVEFKTWTKFQNLRNGGGTSDRSLSLFQLTEFEKRVVDLFGWEHMSGHDARFNNLGTTPTFGGTKPFPDCLVTGPQPDFKSTTSSSLFARPTFGKPNTTAFGVTLNSGFGSPQAAPSIFSASPKVSEDVKKSVSWSLGPFAQSAATTPNQGNRGTSVAKYSPTYGKDATIRNGISEQISTKMQCIVHMKEYETKSLEELRFEDYLAQRKGPQRTIVAQPEGLGKCTRFGQTTAAENINGLESFWPMASNAKNILDKPVNAANPGSSIAKYKPTSSWDRAIISGRQQNVQVHIHNITAMREYENKSCDEVRMEDYLAKRAGGTQFAGFDFHFAQPSSCFNPFGQAGNTSNPAASSPFRTTAQSTTVLFGQADTRPLFSTGFGTGPAPKPIRRPVFDSTNPTSPFVFKALGKDNTKAKGYTKTTAVKSANGCRATLKIAKYSKGMAEFGNFSFNDGFKNTPTTSGFGANGARTSTATPFDFSTMFVSSTNPKANGNHLGGTPSTTAGDLFHSNNSSGGSMGNSGSLPQVAQPKPHTSVHQDILSRITTPYGDNAIFKDLKENEKHDVTKSTYPSSQTVANGNNSSPFKVSGKSSSSVVRVKPIGGAFSMKSLFDDLESAEKDLESFTFKPQAKNNATPMHIPPLSLEGGSKIPDKSTAELLLDSSDCQSNLNSSNLEKMENNNLVTKESLSCANPSPKDQMSLSTEQAPPALPLQNNSNCLDDSGEKSDISSEQIPKDNIEAQTIYDSETSNKANAPLDSILAKPIDTEKVQPELDNTDKQLSQMSLSTEQVCPTPPASTALPLQKNFHCLDDSDEKANLSSEQIPKDNIEAQTICDSETSNKANAPLYSILAKPIDTEKVQPELDNTDKQLSQMSLSTEQECPTPPASTALPLQNNSHCLDDSDEKANLSSEQIPKDNIEAQTICDTDTSNKVNAPLDSILAKPIDTEKVQPELDNIDKQLSQMSRSTEQECPTPPASTALPLQNNFHCLDDSGEKSGISSEQIPQDNIEAQTICDSDTSNKGNAPLDSILAKPIDTEKVQPELDNIDKQLSQMSRSTEQECPTPPASTALPLQNNFHCLDDSGEKSDISSEQIPQDNIEAQTICDSDTSNKGNAPLDSILAKPIDTEKVQPELDNIDKQLSQMSRSTEQECPTPPASTALPLQKNSNSLDDSDEKANLSSEQIPQDNIEAQTISDSKTNAPLDSILAKPIDTEDVQSQLDNIDKQRCEINLCQTPVTQENVVEQSNPQSQVLSGENVTSSSSSKITRNDTQFAQTLAASANLPPDSSCHELSNDLERAQHLNVAKNSIPKPLLIKALNNSEPSTTGEIALESTIKASNGKCHPTGIILNRTNYYTIPNMDDLKSHMAEDGSCKVANFEVGRLGYGKVVFPNEMNVAGLNLDEIVFFRNREIIIYLDDDKKPPVGQGLNREAIVTLYRVWPLEGNELGGWSQKLQNICDYNDHQFVEYLPETGSWIYRVKHF